MTIDPSEVQADRNGRADRSTAESENADSASLNARGERVLPGDSGKQKLDRVGGIRGGVKAVEQAGAAGAPRFSNRMEFDARLVYGETAGSGAVILFERGQRELPPLTEQRKRFLAATTEPVFGKKSEPLFGTQNTLKGVELDHTNHRPVIDGSSN
jgi:hypothetical protein